MSNSNPLSSITTTTFNNIKKRTNLRKKTVKSPKKRKRATPIYP